jgi:glutamyl-tRNA synthetase
VRFAPSPTGRLHLGSGRTALYNYLLARQTGGQFILRLEDTDQKRYVPGSEQELIDGLHWLGLDWDEGFDIGGPHAPYRQSERKEIYQHYARQLIAQGDAYICFCSPERLATVRQYQQQNKLAIRYDGTCRNLDPDEAARRVAAGEKHVVRFKMPYDGETIVHDQMRGDIVTQNANLDDYILVKSDGLAVYHLAAMVDDHLMQITHVFRTSEWLPTFPLHTRLIRALGWELPQFYHMSVFLKPSGKGKMSKRESAALMKDGYSIFIKDLEQLGYTPEGVVNWIALMGWSYDDHTEFFNLPDLVQKFSLNKLNPAPAAINFTKLDHFNGLHIRALAIPDLARRFKPFFEAAGYTVDMERLEKITPLLQPRAVTLDDAVPMGGFFFEDDISPEPGELLPKGLSPAQASEAARKAAGLIAALPQLTHAAADEPLRRLAESLGLSAGQFFGLLRVAVTGQTVSPPLLESMEIIGKETVVRRVLAAAEAVNEISS